MNQIKCIKLSLVMAFVIVSCVRDVDCKTVKVFKTDKDSKPEERKLDNFVDFTEEGDQLAVETTEGSVGKGTDVGHTGRECANVQKAIYPVIPVIIASLVGLIGSIIISAIVRLVFKLMNESKDSGADYSYGYDRQLGKRTFFGFDLGNGNFGKLAKNVITAIEKIY